MCFYTAECINPASRDKVEVLRETRGKVARAGLNFPYYEVQSFKMESRRAIQMSDTNKKRKKHSLKKLEEKLTSYELLPYEEALKRDR